jgi:hypothetical protein
MSSPLAAHPSRRRAPLRVSLLATLSLLRDPLPAMATCCRSVMKPHDRWRWVTWEYGEEREDSEERGTQLLALCFVGGVAGAAGGKIVLTTPV